MCKVPERGDTEMHFNRVVVAVVGDGTELRICFHFVWSLDSVPPPTSKKKPQTPQTPSVYIPGMPERLGRVACCCPYLDALSRYRKWMILILFGFYSQTQFTADCWRTPDQVCCNTHISDKSQSHLYAFRDNKYFPSLMLVKQ